MTEGARYRAVNGVDYILHKLPTGNWVLVNTLQGNLWCATNLEDTDPITAFGGDKWLAHFTLVKPQ